MEKGVSGEKRHHKFEKKKRAGGGISTVPSQPEKHRACSGITERKKPNCERGRQARTCTEFSGRDQARPGSHTKTIKITKEREGGKVSTVPSRPRKRRACSEITEQEKTRAVREEREHAHALSLHIETTPGQEATHTKKNTPRYTHICIGNVRWDTMEMTNLTFLRL